VLFLRTTQKRLAHFRRNLFAGQLPFAAVEATKNGLGPPRNVGVEDMNTIRRLGFSALTALSLGVGTAVAQEGPNATVSGSTYFGPSTSGSSDAASRPTVLWTPGEVRANLPIRNAY
jgi:hypothetical protein